MSASVQPAAGLGGWRVLVIGLVAVLAVGIGVAAGSFLLNGRTAGTGGAARYVAADAPMYVELRLAPSEAQDAALRELLGRFPPIEGLDLERPLYDQLGEVIDEELAAEAEVPFTWSDDVAPWFDGSVAFAVTDLPLDEFANPMDPMNPPETEPVPGMLVVLGVTDAAAARDAIDRMLAEAETPGLTESEHRGVRIVSSEQAGAVAVTEDAVLVAPDATSVVTALDVAAAPDAGLSGTDAFGGLIAALPSDWLSFATYDFSEIMAAGMAAGADGGSAAMTEAFEDLLQHLPMRGAMAVTASGDRVTVEAATDVPTGPFAMENEDRGLAAEVPSGTLYFADGGNIGPALAAWIGAVKEAAATEPEAAEQVATAEAALGAELEELVAWVDDGALAAGWDGAAPWAGFVLVPSDMTAAERRIGQLLTFASLATLDPSSGITVREDEVDGVEVTTIEWRDPSSDLEVGAMPFEGLAVQVATTEDRVLLGLGDSFVPAALGLDESASLAADPRYAGAIDALGGTTNAGSTWLDLTGAREAIVSALGPMLEMVDPDGEYATSVEPWLLPLDHLASVSLLEEGIVVHRGALFLK